MNQNLQKQVAAKVAAVERARKRLLAMEEALLEFPEKCVAGCLPLLRNSGDVEKLRAIFQQPIAKALRPIEELRKEGILPARKET